MKGLILLALIVTVGMALWGSAAGASSGGPLAKSAAVSNPHISRSAASDISKARLAGVPAKGSYAFLLKLGVEPTGAAYRANLARGRSAARTAARDQLTTVREAQSRVIAALPSGSHVLYRMHAILSGVAVYTKVSNVPALQRIAGVAHVYAIAPKRPSNSYAVHLVKAPQVWAALGDLGANSTVAIIDTGLDYTHADFGGPGTPAAYQTALANDTATPTFTYFL